jgi:hypothetical protein
VKPIAKLVKEGLDRLDQEAPESIDGEFLGVVGMFGFLTYRNVIAPGVGKTLIVCDGQGEEAYSKGFSERIFRLIRKDLATVAPVLHYWNGARYMKSMSVVINRDCPKGLA